MKFQREAFSSHVEASVVSRHLHIPGQTVPTAVQPGGNSCREAKCCLCQTPALQARHRPGGDQGGSLVLPIQGQEGPEGEWRAAGPFWEHQHLLKSTGEITNQGAVLEICSDFFLYEFWLSLTSMETQKLPVKPPYQLTRWHRTDLWSETANEVLVNMYLILDW